MKTTLIPSAIFLALLFTGCDKKEEAMPETSMFKVSIENVMELKEFQFSGVFNTPVGALEPGGAGPGHDYRFSFDAGPGAKLSFATMYVMSNDLFFAPSGEGIDLFTDGVAISGDITSQVKLLDAGTEINEEPGTGPNQPLNGGPGVGMAENGTVEDINNVNDGFTYAMVEEYLQVTIENDGFTHFTVTISNLANSTTPIAPGVWVIHSDANPLFEEGAADYGTGLKGLAEDGDPSGLGGHLEMNSGYVSPLAPGAWAVHGGGVSPVFSSGSPDLGEGLESLAEDGNPSTLVSALQMKDAIRIADAFTTPIGGSGPGPLLPGSVYEFTFTAEQGEYLSFATMLVHTNDIFISPSDMGIALFNGSTPISGNITSSLMLWDAGTEVNEQPGVGLHQPARLNGGTDENRNVGPVSDSFTYPQVSYIVSVTITPM